MRKYIYIYLYTLYEFLLWERKLRIELLFEFVYIFWLLLLLVLLYVCLVGCLEVKFLMVIEFLVSFVLFNFES